MNFGCVFLDFYETVKINFLHKWMIINLRRHIKLIHIYYNIISPTYFLFGSEYNNERIFLTV